MLRRTTIPTIAWSVALGTAVLPALSQAQFVAPERSFTFSFGVARNDRIDRTVSPAAFGGLGLGGDASFATPLFALDARATLGGGISLLHSAAGLTNERLFDADVRLDLLQRYKPEWSAFRPALGIGALVDASVTEHRYTDVASGRKAFVFGLASLGPTARWTAGAASVDLHVPVVGMVLHPYSAVRVERPFFDPQAVSIATLQAPSLGISYTTRPGRGLGVTYEYRAKLLRYDGVLGVRELSQTFRIGITRRFPVGER